MRVIPRRGLGVVVALGIIAGLAAPKLLEMRRSSTPTTDLGARLVLRVKTHRVIPMLLTERLSTTGFQLSDQASSSSPKSGSRQPSHLHSLYMISARRGAGVLCVRAPPQKSGPGSYASTSG